MSEFIVFVSKEHYNPLGIVRTLGEKGIRPIVVAVKGDLKFVGQSKYVKKKYYVDSPEEGLNLILLKYANKNEKSYILTGDDVVVKLLDNNYDILKDYFYFSNAGENGRIEYFMNKDNMLHLAEEYGLKIAKTWKTRVGVIPSDIEYPVITKAVNSFGREWKEIVFICNNDDELLSAYSNMKSDYILIQKYINKVDEVSFDGFSINNGQDTVILTEVYQEYCIQDKYSPYWNVRNNTNLEITEKIKKIINKIRLNGIFEFEFMIDNEGNFWFLEINFRNTALGYATTIAGMPQIILWCNGMKNGTIDSNYYKEIPVGFKAIAECFDYDVRVKNGIISKHEWKKQYKNADCKLYRGRNDIIPYWRFLWYKHTKMNKH